VPARWGPGLAARGSGSGGGRLGGVAVPVEGWRVPGVAGSSGSGVGAGVHGAGGCVCVCVPAPGYIGRSQPAVSGFRPRLSAVPAVLGRGGSRRRPMFFPIPRQPGAPRLGTEPTALPTAGTAAPAAPGEQVG